MRSILAITLVVTSCGLFPSLGDLTSSDASTTPDVAADVPQTNEGGTDVVVAPDVDAGKTYIRTITIKTTTQGLPKGYTIGVAFPESELQAAITAGKIRSDLNDLRLRGSSGERDRLVDAPPLARVVWFSLASSIGTNATDTTYAITYGFPNDPPGPTDGQSVFAFYDDFNGTSLDPQWMKQGVVNVGGGFATFPQAGLGALTTSAQPPTSTAEWRAKITDPSSAPDTNTGFYYWFGYQHSGDFDASEPWVVWIARATGHVGAEDYADGCSTICMPTPGTQSNAFRFYGIERQPTQTVFSIDNAPAFTISTAINDQALSPMIRNYLVTSDLVVDWYRSRVRLYPEPTVTLGPEQTQ